MSSKLTELMAVFDGSIVIDINNHKAMDQTMVDYIVGMSAGANGWPQLEEIPAELLGGMVSSNTVVEVSLCPRSGETGFLGIAHYDLEVALQIAIDRVSRLAGQKSTSPAMLFQGEEHELT